MNGALLCGSALRVEFKVAQGTLPMLLVGHLLAQQACCWASNRPAAASCSTTATVLLAANSKQATCVLQVLPAADCRLQSAAC